MMSECRKIQYTAVFFCIFMAPAFSSAQDSEAQKKSLKQIDAIFDGSDPVRAQMLKLIAAFESHDIKNVIREADKTRKLNQKKKTLKPRELGLVYSMQGIAYLSSERVKTALPLLKKASVLAKDSRTFYNLACAQSVLGQLPEAERSFRKALEVGSVDGRFGTAADWIDSSKTDEQLVALRARPTYSQIVKEFERRPPVH